MTDVTIEDLQFSATSFTLQTHIAKQDQQDRALIAPLLWKSRKEILNRSGSSLKNISWKVRLIGRDDYNQHLSELGVIGTLSYLSSRLGSYPSETENPESCVVSCAIGPEAFGVLLAATLKGRGMSTLTVSVKGLLCGPDRIIVWDVQEERVKHVTSLWYEL